MPLMQDMYSLLGGQFVGVYSKSYRYGKGFDLASALPGTYLK